MSKKLLTRMAIGISAVVIITGVVLDPGHTETPVEIAESLPADLVAGLAGMGLMIEPPPSQAQQLAAVDLATALDVAETNSVGLRNPAAAGMALLSNEADEAVRAAEPRLVYVLIYLDLELRPVSWPRGAAGNPPINHELVVFVDAATGEFVGNATFR